MIIDTFPIFIDVQPTDFSGSSPAKQIKSIEKYPESDQYLKTWYDTAIGSRWLTPNDVKQSYANASILKDSRIVFNIKGNAFRLVAKFNFEKQWVFIRFIGTHSEYDRIDADTI